MASEAVAVILREIAKIRYQKPVGGNVMILCPFHADKDSPSLSINIDPDASVPVGSHWCFGCQHKGGWNPIAEALGLQTVSDDLWKSTEADTHSKKYFDSRIEEEFTTLEKMSSDHGVGMLMPFDDGMDWRHINPKVLKRLGAQVGYSSRAHEAVAVLPVMVDGELMGGVVAMWQKPKKGPTYINAGGKWSKTWGLFPYDLAAEQMNKLEGRIHRRVLCLTEGPRDALRLLSEGIPAMAILGVSSWSTAKRDLIDMLDPTEVWLCFDSDKPGVRATKALYNLLHGYLPIKCFRLRDYVEDWRAEINPETGEPYGEKLDPANMPKEIVRDLKRLLKK